MHLSPKIKLVIGAVIISFSAVFVKLSDVSSESAAFYRTFFGAAAYLIFLLIKRKLKLKIGLWIIVPVSAGIFFAADLFCWHKSIFYVGPGLSTLLGNFQIFIVALFSFLILKEKIKPVFIFSALLALIGLLLIIKGNISADENFIYGLIFGLITSFFYAGFVLLLKKAQMKNSSSALNMLIVSLSTAIVCLIIIFSKGESVKLSSSNDLVLMLAYGIVCQFFGWFLISSSLKSVKASLAALILILQPVFSYLWDVIIFSKKPGIGEVTGAIISVTAIYWGIKIISENS